ncbi:uncharacterized protein LOC122169417 [Centrocercus urophasianus]|uniref:uncharacterized protein LOC122169417 n=1 Tax=Centrocercus urophasianus TaxID=9002 RepID=UPI001C650B6D|nr:uncharacterized protein LOC122169417 [Centrocercus urophasianus]
MAVARSGARRGNGGRAGGGGTERHGGSCSGWGSAAQPRERAAWEGFRRPILPVKLPAAAGSRFPGLSSRPGRATAAGTLLPLCRGAARPRYGRKRRSPARSRDAGWGFSASPLVRDRRDWGAGEDLPAPDCRTAKRDNDKRKRIAEWFGWGQVISGPCDLRTEPLPSGGAGEPGSTLGTGRVAAIARTAVLLMPSPDKTPKQGSYHRNRVRQLVYQTEECSSAARGRRKRELPSAGPAWAVQRWSALFSIRITRHFRSPFPVGIPTGCCPPPAGREAWHQGAETSHLSDVCTKQKCDFHSFPELLLSSLSQPLSQDTQQFVRSLWSERGCLFKTLASHLPQRAQEAEGCLCHALHEKHFLWAGTDHTPDPCQLMSSRRAFKAVCQPAECQDAFLLFTLSVSKDWDRSRSLALLPLLLLGWPQEREECSALSDREGRAQLCLGHRPDEQAPQHHQLVPPAKETGDIKSCL